MEEPTKSTGLSTDEFAALLEGEDDQVMRQVRLLWEQLDQLDASGGVSPSQDRMKIRCQLLSIIVGQRSVTQNEGTYSRHSYRRARKRAADDAILALQLWFRQAAQKNPQWTAHFAFELVAELEAVIRAAFDPDRPSYEIPAGGFPNPERRPS